MEKRVPHYDLKRVKRVLGSSETLFMTAVALRSSLALKFDLEGVAAVMRTMSVLHFYKSMTS